MGFCKYDHRIIGVVCIFLFVILSVQQEVTSLGLSANVQAFISYELSIKQTDCASITKIILVNLLTLVSSPHACASIN